MKNLIMTKSGEKLNCSTRKRTVPRVEPLPPMCASTSRSAAILQPDTINHKCRRLTPFSAGSILAQDKGPHRFGGTSRAQSPAVRSFYGTRKPNRFSGKPLDSAPLTKENSDLQDVSAIMSKLAVSYSNSQIARAICKSSRERSPECISSLVI